MLIWEIGYTSLFIFGISYGLHSIAYRRGIGDAYGVVSAKKLHTEVNGKKQRFKSGNSFIDKWLSFGGGYYGIMAFVQFVFIELGQIKSFINDWDGLAVFIDSLGINTIVSFILEQFQNFVAAIVWPVDILAQYSLLEIAVYLFVTYVVYEASRHYARVAVNRPQQAI